MDIRWGFLGAGFVASRAMAPAVHESRGARLFAVASRDRDRSRSLEPEVVHARYEELLNDERVDAVYISLANHQHVEWVTRALLAGKHVLCEKPLGITASETRHMFDVATECGKQLIEATWVRWHPRFKRIVELSTSGALGELQHIDTSFTSISEMTENYRLHPEMGGGALLDVGCYQVHVWVSIFGSSVNVNVEEVRREVGSTGVDLTTRARAGLDAYATATSLSSFVLPSSQTIVVRGADTQIQTVQGEAFTSWRESSSLLVGNNEESFGYVDAFVEMVENVSSFLRDGSGWILPPDQTVRVAEIIDSIAAH